MYLVPLQFIERKKNSKAGLKEKTKTRQQYLQFILTQDQVPKSYRMKISQV